VEHAAEKLTCLHTRLAVAGACGKTAWVTGIDCEHRITVTSREWGDVNRARLADRREHRAAIQRIIIDETARATVVLDADVVLLICRSDAV
jgi:hypothetical protein